MLNISDDACEQSPDGENEQEDNAQRVGDAMALSEGVSESTRCSNMLLQ